MGGEKDGGGGDISGRGERWGGGGHKWEGRKMGGGDISGNGSMNPVAMLLASSQSHNDIHKVTNPLHL